LCWCQQGQAQAGKGKKRSPEGVFGVHLESFEKPILPDLASNGGVWFFKFSYLVMANEVKQSMVCKRMDGRASLAVRGLRHNSGAIKSSMQGKVTRRLQADLLVFRRSGDVGPCF
jgi:hypothetical protein